ncbi:hypothetical protein C1645_821829 [Glomus cerebriforme]|uniref:Uncharacterized protein n=1 Tax=Glomus cerebriforme TaxID=658196 RepID=A0A397T2P1_9GLOM|nr:hypothetical protein C1645_821829 [Glomus cerebriforme]
MDDTTINNHFKNLKDLKSNNSSFGNKLKMRYQKQEQLFKNMNKNLDQFMLNFEALNDNSKHIHKMMLKNILKEVDITIEEFESLMRLKNKSNHQFHKGSQTKDDANIQLETFPENIKVLLKKVLKALEIWGNSDS